MNNANDILLVYDKQCPACDFYCELVQIRASVGTLQLIDAREDTELLQRITAAGHDIDEGMVLIVRDQLYYGADAIHRLALLGTRNGLFNRLASWTFRSEQRSRLLYPALKYCRNLLLKLLGRTRINNLNIPGNDRF
ncbi:MAG: DCC1-like thiol-disulfide oxidoreductase family protein [Woeseia sp.]